MKVVCYNWRKFLLRSFCDNIKKYLFVHCSSIMLNYMYAVMFQTSRQDSSHSAYVSIGLVLTLWPKQALTRPTSQGVHVSPAGLCSTGVCPGGLCSQPCCSRKSLWQCHGSPELIIDILDTFWLTWVPPCFPGLEPEGNSLRLTSAVSGVRNLGVFLFSSWNWEQADGEAGYGAVN